MVGVRGTQGGQSQTPKHLKMGHFQKIALFRLFASYNLNLKGLYYQNPNNYHREHPPRVPGPPWGLQGAAEAYLEAP